MRKVHQRHPLAIHMGPTVFSMCRGYCHSRLILGLRYARISNKIGILGGPNLVDGAQDWLDPLVGGRWIWGF